MNRLEAAGKVGSTLGLKPHGNDVLSPDLQRFGIKLNAASSGLLFAGDKYDLTLPLTKEQLLSVDLTNPPEEIKGFIAKADALELADLIEYEWLSCYKLAAQYMYNPDEILPADMYVFDETMNWFIAFTHETTDVETDDPIKESESRYCIISM